MMNTNGESATGTIIALRDRSATVAIESSVTCPRCAAGTGCGAGIFQKTARRQVIDVPVPASDAYRPGDEIELTISSRSLLRAALLAYGIPLLMLLGALAAHQVFGGQTDDAGAILYAAAGVLAGLVVSRKILSGPWASGQFVPVAGRLPGERRD